MLLRTVRIDLFEWLLMFMAFKNVFKIAKHPHSTLFFIGWTCLNFFDNWLLVILTLVAYEHSIII